MISLIKINFYFALIANFFSCKFNILIFFSKNTNINRHSHKDIFEFFFCRINNYFVDMLTSRNLYLSFNN